MLKHTEITAKKMLIRALLSSVESWVGRHVHFTLHVTRAQHWHSVAREPAPGDYTRRFSSQRQRVRGMSPNAYQMHMLRY